MVQLQFRQAFRLTEDLFGQIGQGVVVQVKAFQETQPVKDSSG